MEHDTFMLCLHLPFPSLPPVFSLSFSPSSSFLTLLIGISKLHSANNLSEYTVLLVPSLPTEEPQRVVIAIVATTKQPTITEVSSTTQPQTEGLLDS